jgi:hypothetical protein
VPLLLGESHHAADFLSVRACVCVCTALPSLPPALTPATHLHIPACAAVCHVQVLMDLSVTASAAAFKRLSMPSGAGALGSEGEYGGMGCLSQGGRQVCVVTQSCASSAWLLSSSLMSKSQRFGSRNRALHSGHPVDPGEHPALHLRPGTPHHAAILSACERAQDARARRRCTQAKCSWFNPPHPLPHPIPRRRRIRPRTSHPCC